MIARLRDSEPSSIGRISKKRVIRLLSGAAPAASSASVISAPSRPDQRALEDERPANEGVGRADQAHDLDLLGAGHHGQPDRVHDDEQDRQADQGEQDQADGPEQVGHGQDPVHQVLDLLDGGHDVGPAAAGPGPPSPN